MASIKSVVTLMNDGDWIESKDQSPTGIRLIQTGNIGNGEYLDKGNRAKYISEKTFHELDCTEVVPGDILISRLPDPIGRACIVPHDIGKAITAVDCTIVRLNRHLCNAHYFVYYTQSELYQHRLEQFFAGTTRTRISRKNLEQIEIPLPAINIQEQIAAKLDKVAELISLRKQQIAKLDELVKARFVEMFGDPVDNPMCWTTHPLDAVCNTIVDCPHSTPSYTTDNTGFMCIRTSIVKKNKILWDEIEYIPEEEYNKRIQRKKPAKGDIVYTREGAILGIAAIIDRECNVALGQRSMLLSPNPEKCCSEFLCIAMNFDSFFRKALGGISGSASPHINVGDIKAFEIILPPLALQHQFATFVAQTDQQKLTIQHSLAQLELLKKALMQKYFG